MLSPVRRDILAVSGAVGWAAVVNLLAVPLYVRLMGIEAYGLVGLFATLQATLNLLDLGLSPTLNRTIAAYTVRPEQAQDARDLVRTIELGYWTLGGLLGLVVASVSSFLAHHWVKTASLPAGTVREAFLWMAAVAAAQWPVTLYSGGLTGLQQLVPLAATNALVTTVRFGGALLVLRFVSPTVTAFFAWQLFASILHTGSLTTLLWWRMPRGERSARFAPVLLRRVWRFAAGMSSTAALSLLLTQLDKVILSKILPLQTFGYYVLASVLAGGLVVVLSPISTALFPRFTQMLARDEIEGLRQLYHAGCQSAATLVMPIAVVMSLFSREVLTVWTRDPVVVTEAHAVLSILILGSALNVLMHLPYSLQLAAGWTRLTNGANAVSVVLLTPLLVVLARRFGAVGAASVWLALNVAYVLTVVPLMHRRLLVGSDARRWFAEVGLIVAVVSAVALGLRAALPRALTPGVALVSLACAWGACQLAAVLVAPEVRRRAAHFVADLAAGRSRIAP